MTEKIKVQEKQYNVPAVDQASRILFSLAGCGAVYMSLNEICAETGIHKSKAFAILETLQRYGLVQRNMDGKGYSLGPGLVSLSRKVLDDLSPTRLAEPILKELARETSNTAILGLISGKDVFVAAKCDGEGNMGLTMRIGHRLPLTYGAHGKAIVSFLSAEERESILNSGSNYFYGDMAGFDRDRLFDEIARCRHDWFAEDPGQTNPGLNVITAPVLGPGGNPIGFIEIFVLFSAEVARRFGPKVAEAGKKLSRLLGAKTEEVI